MNKFYFLAFLLIFSQVKAYADMPNYSHNVYIILDVNHLSSLKSELEYELTKLASSKKIAFGCENVPRIEAIENIYIKNLFPHKGYYFGVEDFDAVLFSNVISSYLMDKSEGSQEEKENMDHYVRSTKIKLIYDLSNSEKFKELIQKFNKAKKTSPMSAKFSKNILQYVSTKPSVGRFNSEMQQYLRNGI